MFSLAKFIHSVHSVTHVTFDRSCCTTYLSYLNHLQDMYNKDVIQNTSTLKQ